MALTLLLAFAPVPGTAGNHSFLRPSASSDGAGGGEVDGAARVDVDSVRLAENPERLTIRWPAGDSTGARRLAFERRADGLFWRGRLDGGGEAQLTLHAGKVAGVFFTADGAWALEPRAGGSGLRRIDLEGVEVCGGALMASGSSAARRGATPSQGRVSTAAATPRIDILVVYTAAALEAAGSRAAIEATIQSWVDIGNVAFEASEIDLRLRLAAAEPVPTEPSPATNSAELLSSLRRDREIRALRDAHGADYVSLVYERSRGACGRAFLMADPGPGFANSAVSVVQRGCGAPITFIHELGHVLGSHHHPEDGGIGAFPFSYGHWSEPEARQTAMSTRFGCCPQQPYFSNPEVVVEGWRTGVANERDNARTFAATAPIVAAFGERPCPLPPGDPDYCAECGPCAAGEGDCDGNRQCSAGLECVRRAGKELGFAAKTDVCLPAAPADCPLAPGDPDYCRRCGPCDRGDGDCDGNPECAGGLTCLTDAGARFGLGPNVDVCDVGRTAPVNCTLTRALGDPLYCRVCGPCQLDEGGCSEDMECAPFLTCVDGVGGEHGFASDVGVCRFPDEPAACPVALGRPAYCRKCGPCGEGEGGCKRDRQCADGLVCVRRAGADFGFAKKIGVCLPADAG